MPVEISLEPPAGYALEAGRAGENVKIAFREFTSTEDGQHFIQRLESIPSTILQKLPNPIFPSQVDHLLAIFSRESKATVYINELELRAGIRAARPIEAGVGVTKDDIADMERLDLGVQIPDDAGFLFVFSVGWRKGLFYDFGPTSGPNSQRRRYDVSSVLGQAYCHVLFQERFSISAAEWDALFAAKWFPFASLRNETINTLISRVRSGWNPDEELDDIISEVKGRIPQMLDSWRTRPSFAEHLKILEHAAERFQNDDPMSCTALLFPRIEGILRTHHTSLGMAKKPSPDNLVRSAVATKIEKEKCLLLPHRFDAYLRDVYFASFKPDASEETDITRHSVAHGVASSSQFNQKSAAISILIIHQLFYFLDAEQNPQLLEDEEAGAMEKE